MHISIRNAAIEIDGKMILEDINFDIKNNEHIGIVGRNGAGKTTFLKALIDNTLFSEGIGEEKFQITKLGKFQIGYLKQITFSDESLTLIEEIENSFQNIINLAHKLDNYLLLMQNDSSEEVIKEYSETLENFKILGGYSYQKEYEVMLKKFGFTESDKKKKLKEFSGGQKTKIAFIKLLLAKPDLLILDEPTNHLDIEAIIWLEEYLKKYKGALILVSHDRMFMNNIVSFIYDIEYGKLKRYVGNYEAYEKQKELNYQAALEDYEYQQKEIKKLRSIYERFRYKPAKASLAMSRLHQLEKMDILERPRKEDTKVFKTNLDGIPSSSLNVLSFKNLGIGYDQELFKLNLQVNKGMRLGILGHNGIGKSTLLKTIVNLISPTSGKITYGMNVSIGYFDQAMALVDSSKTIIDDFRENFPNFTLEKCRNALGSFLFKGEDVFKTINVLSGGEKVRLELCKIFYQKPNLLILDESTNHLDIIGKEHLENILADYPGTIIFVSHDRYFIKKIATELLVFNDQGVNFYQCGYEDYLKKQKAKEEVVEITNKKVQKEKNTQNNSYNFNKKIKALEKEITNLENKLKELKAEIYLEEIYTDHVKMQELETNIQNTEDLLEAKNQEWLELSEQNDRF